MDRTHVGFGPHLTLDLHGCDKKKLADREFIYNLLDELPSIIGMHKISMPQVSHFIGNPMGNKNSFDQGGVSAFVLIAESHITIHTFAMQGSAFIDIFSCKHFDVDKAIDYLVKKFSAKKVEKNLFDRGLEFPKSVELVKPIVVSERRRVAKTEAKIQ